MTDESKVLFNMLLDFMLKINQTYGIKNEEKISLRDARLFIEEFMFYEGLKDEKK